MGLGAEDRWPFRGSANVVATQRADVVASHPHRVIEAPVEPQTPDGSGWNVFQYWCFAVKHRWLLAAALIAGLALGTVATLLTHRVYRATATVQIDEEPQKVVAVESQRPAQSGGGDEKFYQTQYELLKSRALALRVADSERLATDPRFLKQAGLKAARDARADATADAISKHLFVEPVRLSRIVKVSYESTDPVLAARIANAVAANYVQWNLERRYNASADARHFLEGRLQQFREALEAAQRRGNDYAQRNQLITIGGSGGSGAETGATGETLAATDLATVNDQLAKATAERIQAEHRWRQAMTTPDLALPELASRDATQKLVTARDTAWAEYEQKSTVFKPDYPEMVEARHKIDAFDRELATEANAVRQGLKTEFEVARKNEAQFQGEVDRRKRELLASQGKRVEQGFINTDIATTKSLYEGMLASYKEIGIAGAIGQNNLSIVDRAIVPKRAIKPSLSHNLAIFGALGLALGGAIAFIRDRLDTSIKIPEDVEEKLGLPLLGAVPVARKNVPPVSALQDAKSPLTEAYYSVRTALEFATEEGAPRSLLVTSIRPGEGKTISCLAIAMGFARLGLRVLLVDGDMRDPSLHKLLAGQNGVGLSNLLAGGDEVHPAVQPTSLKNLSFLASGPLPPNPAELLGGSRMRSFLHVARETFDLVIIDGPPVMGLADALQVASQTEGTAVVVEAGQTKQQLALATIRRLQAGRGRLVGAILTKFDLDKAGYAYRHAHGPGYGYGYGYDYGRDSSHEPLSGLALRRFPGRALAWFGGRRSRAS